MISFVLPDPVLSDIDSSLLGPLRMGTTSSICDTFNETILCLITPFRYMLY